MEGRERDTILATTHCTCSIFLCTFPLLHVFTIATAFTCTAQGVHVIVIAPLATACTLLLHALQFVHVHVHV